MAPVARLETGVVNVERMPQVRGARSIGDMIIGPDADAREAALRVVEEFGNLDTMDEILRQLVDCPNCPKPINGQGYRRS